MEKRWFPIFGFYKKSLMMLLILGVMAVVSCSTESGTPEDEAGNSSVETGMASKNAAESLFPTKQVSADPPYIVKENCKFFLVTPTGTISTTSEYGSGISGNATLNWGGYQISLSECEVVGNPQNLDIY